MTLYTTLQIGELHTNHCEDYLITAEIGKNKLLCAVMDGCSMGTDSYFAATLTGKLLRKISLEYSYKEFLSKEPVSLSQTLEAITAQLFEALRHAKHMLQLKRNELLNTLLIGVIDTTERTGEFLCIGDGLICINGELHEYDQDNRPDYIGYHLHEAFDSWYAGQRQRITATGLQDVSLVTDGIFTFRPFNKGQYAKPGDVITTLLLDTTYSNADNMLHRKLLDIENNWGLRPGDDLAIVRLIF